VGPPDVAGLLTALPPGKSVWIEARGRSMWPLLLPGDRVKAVRCAAETLSVGDVAVLVRSDGVLVCHGVVGVAPIRTANMSGTLDDGLLPLARVERVRRGTTELPLPRTAVRALQSVYAALVHSPLRPVLHSTLLSPQSAAVRRSALRPQIRALAADDLHALELALSLWNSAPVDGLSRAFLSGRAAAVFIRSGRIGGAALVSSGTLVHAHLLRRLRGLGLERQLIDAVMGPDVVRAEVDPAETGFIDALTTLGIPVVAPSRR
jgi:hypothetical protein